MRTGNVQPATSSAFTLVELLIAMTILALLAILLVSLLGGVNRAWVSGEQQAETFQDGRAVLELMSRELAQTVISPRLQFVQNPTLTGITQRANSGSLFWQAGLASTNSGNLSEVGYYLSENTTQHTFQLNRFFVPPTDATNYQIFTNSPNDRNALWVTNFVAVPGLNTLVSDSVVAFWARCLDLNGDPIPWISSLTTSNGDTGAAPLQFNSAGHFQPAILGQSTSFKYTSAASAAQAHLLPTTVELTIITVDSKTMQRSRASVPALPALTKAQDIPNAITTFNQNLIANNIRAARTFSTRVTLKTSDQ